ncbi:MAG: penicillin-binding protein 2 [Lachnospiraceae bacterium]|nr:penicillin-binding protein 2 [Lachnospiraceae bacterium]
MNKKKTLQKSVVSNGGIYAITYFFVLLFVVMVGYYVHFMVFESKDVINNSYNKRQDLLAESVVRGKIYGAGKEVLAETKTRGDGTEYRYYPYGAVFCHVVGRSEHGKTGIELSENFNLLTCSNKSIGTLWNELNNKKNPGDSVVTTLDVDLQKAAYEALGNRKGAVVALEPSTGKVLAMVSKKDYDPNEVSENWESLTEDADKESRLMNRATQFTYPPGSTFKLLTALEYVRENKKYEDFTFDCDGQEIFSGVKINCYHGSEHGKVDLKKALAKSCNGAFAKIGTELNFKKFRKLCNSFGFNTELPTDLVHTNSTFALKASSKKEEMPQTAIGQGDTLITPLHNAMIAATIANKGVMMEPYVVDHLETEEEEIVSQKEPVEAGRILKEKEAKQLTDWMKNVVDKGTASALSDFDYSVAGKTGSAEFDSKKSSHAWFIGFAPADHPKIAIAVIVEGAGSGSEYAVPVAKKLFKNYLGN